MPKTVASKGIAINSINMSVYPPCSPLFPETFTPTLSVPSSTSIPKPTQSEGTVTAAIKATIDPVPLVRLVDDGHTKAGPLPRVNPSQRVTQPCIPLVKLGSAVVVSRWH